MSYDLFFKSRNPNSKPEAKAFASYFKQRKHYEVSDHQAIYKNETTGVYFIFDIGDVGDEEQPDLAPASFNLNYLRPHVFGLEAEPEVRAFVDEFGLLVSDPQVGGTEDGEYLSEVFCAVGTKGMSLDTVQC